MASIIGGYSYDIFISYRLKDNRHDGWVTGFVDDLKGELGSTFKEDVGVYFDSNPRDGLLENHDVDESLKDKLKCLVFIPVISRTYCDPKSFAWEHEFRAFVDQASGDRFGLKIRLPGGNVASRVLPVRIHDVDSTDLKLFESVSGSTLRGIEFIYKSPGVNRPLRSKEENPHDNLNHTVYRNQINKVAMAIEEIIRGMKSNAAIPANEISRQNFPEGFTHLPGSGIFLDYKGLIDQNRIDLLLEKLKSTGEFISLNKTTGKKVYSLFSECLDNISKYALKPTSGQEETLPQVSVGVKNNMIIIHAQNPISEDRIDFLERKLRQINELDEDMLRAKYDDKISRDLQEGETSAGLGFLLMVLKSGNRIEYHFTRKTGHPAWFDLKITVNNFIGKKLIIEQTVNSPKIIFDPDNHIFEISGESRPANVAEFYEVLFAWLNEYYGHLPDLGDSGPAAAFNFNFEYFNSSSSKYILDFCRQIAGHRSNGKNLAVRWHYENEDLDMLEAGKELSRIAKFPFEFVRKD